MAKRLARCKSFCHKRRTVACEQSDLFTLASVSRPVYKPCRIPRFWQLLRLSGSIRQQGRVCLAQLLIFER